MTLVYLDTSVWIARFWTHDRHHQKTIPIFRSIRNGTYTVLITHHILNEIAEVIKKKTILNLKRLNNSSDNDYKNIYQTKLTTLLNIILRLPNVRIQNPNVSTDKILQPSFNVMQRNAVQISIDNNCPICRNAYNFWDYDAPDERDILHGLLAVELGCDLLITFDSDYRCLQNEPEFSTLAISIL